MKFFNNNGIDLEARSSFGAYFNHIAESSFTSMSPCLQMRLGGWSAAGENRQILHILILLAKCLINLTQG